TRGGVRLGRKPSRRSSVVPKALGDHGDPRGPGRGLGLAQLGPERQHAPGRRGRAGSAEGDAGPVHPRDGHLRPGVGLLQELASQVDLDSLEDAPSMIRVALRDVEKRRKLPAEFVARKAEAVGIAQTHWEQAKQAKDFSLFRDDLKRIVELAIEEAELLGYEEDPYDALLDNYEPETRTADVERVFRELRDELVPMIRAIGERPQVDDSFLYLAYDRKKQWDFGIEMLKAIGFDLERGRQDYSAHPFTIGISGSDVRITTFAADDLKPALFATLHEGG